jgi:hypothetical protein
MEIHRVLYRSSERFSRNNSFGDSQPIYSNGRRITPRAKRRSQYSFA